ncbi:MAG: sugar isomerase domain-containing protein [Elusimicrobia bacterium]|nr:sugar isomerase domain-containing protein [Elusimicrobiota bacterium]
MTNKYIEDVISSLKKLDLKSVETAADIVAGTVARGGIIHTFGAGHSGSVALEGFHRSGAFAAVDAVLDAALMFQNGARAGTEAERREGYILPIIKKHIFTPGDCMVIISNSGRNPAGIDAAIYAKEHGCKIIVITAYAAQKDSKSRHSSGKKLADFADVILDNLAGKDEANITLFDGKKFGPVSTITGAALINAVYFRAAEKLLARGIKPDVYSSSNAGGDDSNAVIEQKYSAKIKHL